MQGRLALRFITEARRQYGPAACSITSSLAGGAARPWCGTCHPPRRPSARPRHSAGGGGGRSGRPSHLRRDGRAEWRYRGSGRAASWWCARTPARRPARNAVHSVRGIGRNSDTGAAASDAHSAVPMPCSKACTTSHSKSSAHDCCSFGPMPYSHANGCALALNLATHQQRQRRDAGGCDFDGGWTGARLSGSCIAQAPDRQAIGAGRPARRRWRGRRALFEAEEAAHGTHRHAS